MIKNTDENMKKLEEYINTRDFDEIKITDLVNYFAYKASFRTINVNQNLTNVTNTTNVTNPTNITNITQPIGNGTNSTFLKNLYDYLLFLASALYGAWKPIFATLLNGFLMIVNALEEIYNYELNESPLVMGVQGNLWTERVITGERIDYMIFPRLIAIAERGWTNQENLDYTDFMKRLENEYRYLDSINVYYYDINDFEHHPEPLR